MGLDNLSEYALKCPLIDLVLYSYIVHVKRVLLLHKKYTTLNPMEVVFDKGNYIFQELHGAYVAVTYTMCIPECIVLM